MQAPVLTLILFVIVIAGIYGLARRFCVLVTVHDYETGLKYTKGRFEKTLEPNIYLYFKPTSEIVIEDIRQRTMITPGQDVLTKDNIGVKISMAMIWTVKDALKLHKISQSGYSDVYTHFQIAIRDAVDAFLFDELIENRPLLAEKVTGFLKPKLEEMGIEATSINVRDIILPAAVKRAYAGALEARKDAERDLEKARGEHAVLRKLANTSKMIAENPGLLQLRTLQTFSQSQNVTVFLGETGQPESTKTSVPANKAKNAK